MSPRAVFILLALALVSSIPKAAFADHDPGEHLSDDHVVDTQTILSGPRWYFTTTPNGRVITHRGKAGAIVLGRDRFNAEGTTAVMVEGQLGAGIGGIGRTEYAGIAFGVKLRTRCHRVELGLALAALDYFDPRHVTDLEVRPGFVSQLAFDLDDSKPHSTRVVLRAELRHPSETLSTLDTFVGIGTRWH